MGHQDALYRCQASVHQEPQNPPWMHVVRDRASSEATQDEDRRTPGQAVALGVHAECSSVDRGGPGFLQGWRQAKLGAHTVPGLSLLCPFGT